MRDLLKLPALRRRLAERLEEANAQIRALGGEAVDLETMYSWGAELGEKLAPYIGDASEKLARHGVPLRM